MFCGFVSAQYVPAESEFAGLFALVQPPGRKKNIYGSLTNGSIYLVIWYPVGLKECVRMLVSIARVVATQ